MKKYSALKKLTLNKTKDAIHTERQQMNDNTMVLDKKERERQKTVL